MAKLIIQVAALLVATALVVDAAVVVVVNGRKRCENLYNIIMVYNNAQLGTVTIYFSHCHNTAVSVEGLPAGCQAEVDVEKRDNPNEIDFVVCVKHGEYYMPMRKYLYDRI